MTVTMDPPMIDLSALPPLECEDYAPERITEWLRTSGGTIGERTLKCAAADLIESAFLSDEPHSA